MSKFDGLDLDLRALQVLVMVQETQSVSAAAARLDVSQSAVSYTLDRLRKVFGDPLFVRQGRGIASTERGRDLAGEARELLDRFERMRAPRAFDPARAQDRLTISCNHYENRVFLPKLVARIRDQAPGLRLKIIQSRVAGHEQLVSGECDLLLSPVARPPSGSVYQQALIEDRYVCIAGARFSLPEQEMRLDARRFAGARHVRISYEGGWRPFYVDELAALGIAPDYVLDLASSGNVDRVIADTDLLATVPARLAGGFGPPCRVLESPFTTRFTVYQFWPARHHASPAHMWLRECLRALAGEIGAA